MFRASSRQNTRVLVIAPTGRDAPLIASTLESHQLFAEPVGTISDFCGEIQKGAGVGMLTEESLASDGLSLLTHVLASQPAWSDLPIIILTASIVEDKPGARDLASRLDPLGNVSLLERPLRTQTLVRAVRVALRSRRRQYELKALNETLEARVLERTAELERLNSEAEGFNYSISHDLRAPLRAIASTSHMLLQDCGDELSEEACRLLHRQIEAATKLAVLIDDLLKLSRLSHREMAPKVFDLSALAAEVVQELESGGIENRCTFSVYPGLSAFGDPFLIKFVLVNLLTNGCKFSPNGGKITFGQTPGGPYFVEDHGIGFDMQYLNKIFVPFERLVSDTDFPGTGIGLANVKRIVERHGGKVWAESQIGKGTTFYFTLEKLPDRPPPIISE